MHIAQLITCSSHVQITLQRANWSIADIVHYMNCPLLEIGTVFLLNAVILRELQKSSTQHRQENEKTLYFEERCAAGWIDQMPPNGAKGDTLPFH